MADFQLSATSLALLSASIGAIAAILGHVTAGLLNIGREYYMDQRKIRRAENAAAIEVSVALYSIMSVCHNIVVCERLIVAPDDPLDFSFECKLPSLELIGSIAYRDLESNMALEVAKVRSELYRAVDYIATIDIVPPHYGDVVFERRWAFAVIGARISIILNRILAANHLDAHFMSGQYDPEHDFKKAIEAMLASRDQSPHDP